jgi:porin
MAEAGITRYLLIQWSRRLGNAGVVIKWIVLSGYVLVAMAAAGIAYADPDAEAPGGTRPNSLGGLTDPSTLLPEIDERRTQKDSLFSVAPMRSLLDSTGKAKQDLYDATGLKLGAAIAHVFQGLTDSIGDEDKRGTATTLDLLGTWDLFNKGQSTQAQLVFHVQSRWDYGTMGPEELGSTSLGSIIGTADTYAEYSRTFVVRNLYWRQGAPETGWVYRLGKITPDALISSSTYLDSQTTFLPSGGTGPFTIALPDSGLGAIGAWYFNDRAALVGLVSDANADRFNEGDIGEGDYFTAAELHFKVAPITPNAPYSKLTLWHTDGTHDGEAINAMTGASGWGYYIMHQQELTADGRAIGILRYGKGFDDSAVYEEQAAAHFLLYEPRLLTRLKHDVVGVAFNWASAPLDNSRNEKNIELFYRFPIFPDVDTTLSYQSVIDPALTRDVDHASVFSLRIRMTF